MRLWWLFVLICPCVGSAFPATLRSIDDESNEYFDGESHDAAIYVVNQLKQMSDSGVYESIELSRILSSEKIDGGIYHTKYVFRLRLESPSFASRREAEEVNIIFMEDNKGQRSFAIDNFPQMSNRAIEEYRQHKFSDLHERRKHLFQHIRSLPVAL